MFSDEALSRILTEADRIVQDAQELLNRVFALRLVTAETPA